MPNLRKGSENRIGSRHTYSTAVPDTFIPPIWRRPARDRTDSRSHSIASCCDNAWSWRSSRACRRPGPGRTLEGGVQHTASAQLVGLSAPPAEFSASCERSVPIEEDPNDPPPNGQMNRRRFSPASPLPPPTMPAPASRARCQQREMTPRPSAIEQGPPDWSAARRPGSSPRTPAARTAGIVHRLTDVILMLYLHVALREKHELSGCLLTARRPSSTNRPFLRMHRPIPQVARGASDSAVAPVSPDSWGCIREGRRGLALEDRLPTYLGAEARFLSPGWV